MRYTVRLPLTDRSNLLDELACNGSELPAKISAATYRILALEINRKRIVTPGSQICLRINFTDSANQLLEQECARLDTSPQLLLRSLLKGENKPLFLEVGKSLK